MSQDFNDWIRRLRDSDETAFRMFFEHFQQPIYRFLYFKTGHAQTAEDLLQETFLKVWAHRRSLRENTSLRSYLFTMAYRLALNDLRYHQTKNFHHPLTDDEFLHTDTPDSQLEEIEFQSALQKAVEDLPERPRLVFVLSRVDELSYKEIAQQLSISVKTVESHMGKALKLLRESMARFF